METGHVISLISKIRERANRLIINELNSHTIHNLAVSHGDILVTLFYYQTLSMKELARKIERSKSTVTSLIDKLVALGYVKKIKDDADNRVTNIELTEAGKALKPVIDEISGKLISKVYDGFSELERELTIKLLTRVKDNL